jgi:hypothetical protein
VKSFGDPLDWLAFGGVTDSRQRLSAIAYGGST